MLPGHSQFASYTNCRCCFTICFIIHLPLFHDVISLEYMFTYLIKTLLIKGGGGCPPPTPFFLICNFRPPKPYIFWKSLIKLRKKIKFFFEKCQRVSVARFGVSKKASGKKLSPPRPLTLFGSKLDKTLLGWY